MKVQKLTLRDFRNISELSFTPDPKLNFLVGKNGQGKTSVLEALAYLSTLRSFRSTKTAEVIHFGSNGGEISCEIIPDVEDGRDWKTDLKIAFSLVDAEKEKATKVAFINGKPFKSSTAYLSQRFGSFELGFHTIIFNPSDHDLVRGEPSVRRSYLDRVLAAEDVEYLKHFQKYQRLLDQRNALLKSSEIAPPRDLLLGFTEPLSKHSAFLTRRRLEWILRLAERLNDIMRYIAPGQPQLRLVYLSNWVPPTGDLCIRNNNLGVVHFAGHSELPSLELLEQAFWKRLSDLEAAELKNRSTLVGPHRDDWAFFQGAQIMRGHGSQGEVRSALLALKLAEIELFRSKTGHRPLFLLDDFSSELDQDRRSFLLRFLMETDLQVFVTTTDDSSLRTLGHSAGKRYWVHNGSLRESGPNQDDDRDRIDEG